MAAAEGVGPVRRSKHVTGAIVRDATLEIPDAQHAKKPGEAVPATLRQLLPVHHRSVDWSDQQRGRASDPVCGHSSPDAQAHAGRPVKAGSNGSARWWSLASNKAATSCSSSRTRSPASSLAKPPPARSPPPPTHLRGCHKTSVGLAPKAVTTGVAQALVACKGRHKAGGYRFCGSLLAQRHADPGRPPNPSTANHPLSPALTAPPLREFL